MFAEDLGRPGISGLLAELDEPAPSSAASPVGVSADAAPLRSSRRHLRSLPQSTAPSVPAGGSAGRGPAEGAAAAEAPGTWAPVVASTGARSDSVRSSLEAFHAFLERSRP